MSSVLQNAAVMRLLILAAVTASALLWTSCGGQSAGGGPDAAVAPAVTVERLDGGAPFQLAEVNASKRPKVIAIGGRDSPAPGRKFVNRHRLRTPTILFDEPMSVWEAHRSGTQRPPADRSVRRGQQA